MLQVLLVSIECHWESGTVAKRNIQWRLILLFWIILHNKLLPPLPSHCILWGISQHVIHPIFYLDCSHVILLIYVLPPSTVQKYHCVLEYDRITMLLFRRFPSSNQLNWCHLFAYRLSSSIFYLSGWLQNVAESSHLSLWWQIVDTDLNYSS